MGKHFLNNSNLLYEFKKVPFYGTRFLDTTSAARSVIKQTSATKWLIKRV
jgi:hypothetical protein